MKGDIILLLKKRYPEYVSGEEISSLLGVSRTAVWKHIRGLRDQGYRIESRSKVGYRLLESPDRLYEHELSGLLRTELIGKKIVYCESVDSTNNLARTLAQEGSPDGTVVIAEEQTGGRGRMGRSWYSPPGQGIWFTLILRPPVNPADAAKITMVSAVAAARGIREYTGLAAGIKWPNDILLSGRKAVGILTEMNAEIDRVNYLVVGIGININVDRGQVSSELAAALASLEEEAGRHLSRIELLAAILNDLDRLYREFIDGNFSQILIEWRKMSVTLGKLVKVTSLHDTDEGLAFDVDEEGALLLRKKDGSVRRILAGDVSLR
ncbi:MAG: biotin--[acetyl-CoA-carboxylase] ligase [Firmicutes bacterium HGW-Firmicutes-14]|nr:MAG: biotin--[acetyl-CoA-carboxylase] ligase [Firmicutes bacterium HGW-Firmicutes-14]